MIEVRGLVKRHGSLRVLNGVALTVERGTTAAIIGPSGSGKSTLLRCLNGLETFDEGEVRVNGYRLPAGPARREQAETLRALRSQVGMVFQQFNLFPHMNVLENVMAGPLYALRHPYAEAEREAGQLLDRVGLADKFLAYPAQLSGGQQQRVAIARALIMNPEAILFDEPTSALDPRMAAEVLSVIADLARSGQTLVIVTHAMDFARDVAHVIHVMQEGRIVESGPLAQVLWEPLQEATRFAIQAKTC